MSVAKSKSKSPAGSSAASPQGCTNLKLRQLGRMVGRHYEAFVAPTGLKGTQYSLLSHVVKLGPLRAGELAAAMQLEASTLTRNLQPLLRDGLLVMQHDPEDARSRLVVATQAGHDLRAKAQRAWKQAQLALNDKLGVERVAALHALLDECRTLLDDDNAGPDD
jgi:DNA-binding MarR family transcriptional regulator